MARKWLLTLAIAAGLAGGCERASSVSPTAPSAATSATSVDANAGAACAIDIGETTNRPLPALHFMAEMFGVAAERADLNCGNVRSLDAKLEAIAHALDQNPPNFDAGCGTSGALLNELESLLKRGELQNISFPPPAPGAPSTLLGIAEELNANWCAAARGVLTGPGLP
jgi:hypothetical protein